MRNVKDPIAVSTNYVDHTNVASYLGRLRGACPATRVLCGTGMMIAWVQMSPVTIG